MSLINSCQDVKFALQNVKADKCPKLFFVFKSQFIVMRLINRENKIAIDVKKNDGPAGGSEKDNVNEPAAVNTALELSGRK